MLLRQLIIIFFISTSCLKGQVSLYSITNNSNNDASFYQIGTMVFSVVNLTTTYFNIKKIHKNDKYRSNAIFGALSGAAQTALGLANINAEYDNSHISTSINIGVGLTTLVTSVVRLATKNPPKEKNISLNFIYLPDIKDNSSLVGFSLRKQF